MCVVNEFFYAKPCSFLPHIFWNMYIDTIYPCVLRLGKGALWTPSDLPSEIIQEMAVYSQHTVIWMEHLQTLLLVKFTQWPVSLFSMTNQTVIVLEDHLYSDCWIYLWWPQDESAIYYWSHPVPTKYICTCTTSITPATWNTDHPTVSDTQKGYIYKTLTPKRSENGPTTTLVTSPYKSK